MAQKKAKGESYSIDFLQYSTNWILDRAAKKGLNFSSTSCIQSIKDVSLQKFRQHCQGTKELYLTGGNNKLVDLVLDIDSSSDDAKFDDCLELARIIFSSILKLPLRFYQSSRGGIGCHARLLIEFPSHTSSQFIGEFVLSLKRSIKQHEEYKPSKVKLCSILGNPTDYSYGILPQTRGGMSYAPKLTELDIVENFNAYLDNPVPSSYFSPFSCEKDSPKVNQEEIEDIQSSPSSLPSSLSQDKRCVDNSTEIDDIYLIRGVDRGIQRKTKAYLYFSKKLNRTIDGYELLKLYEEHDFHRGVVWEGRLRECIRVAEYLKHSNRRDIFQFLPLVRKHIPVEKLVRHRRPLTHEKLAWAFELFYQNIFDANQTFPREFLKDAARRDHAKGLIDFKIDNNAATAIRKELLEANLLELLVEGRKGFHGAKFMLGRNFADNTTTKGVA